MAYGTTERLELEGVELTRIGLGTNRLTDTSDNREFLRQAVEAGVNFIDTAYVYTHGESEQTIGAALGGREDIVIATKGGMGGAAPEVLEDQIDQSLRRLQTDRIDLYYLHRVDAEIPIEKSVEAIDARRSRGEIGHIGLSAVTVEQIERARKVAQIAAVQNPYNLPQRQHEDVVDYCESEGILFVPYYPLRDTSAPRLAEIARSHNATPSQIVLAWLLKRSTVMVPIPGTLSIEHLHENLAALETELNGEEFDALS